MTWKYKDRIFSLFGSWYAQTDSYKDVDGKGIFERYQELFGDDLDDLVTKLENTVQSLVSPSSFLLPYYRFLIAHMGCTLQVGSAEDLKRRMLKVITTLYDHRGKVSNYTYCFDLLGITFNFELLFPDVIKGWDSPLAFDDDDRLFDSWDIVENNDVSIVLYGDAPFTAELWDAIVSILNFNTPYYMRLRRVIYNGMVIPLPVVGAFRYVDAGYVAENYSVEF